MRESVHAESPSIGFVLVHSYSLSLCLVERSAEGNTCVSVWLHYRLLVKSVKRSILVEIVVIGRCLSPPDIAGYLSLIAARITRQRQIDFLVFAVLMFGRGIPVVLLKHSFGGR